jgi:hypothetical protein
VKFLNLLLALYFTLLSGIPCSDQDTCADEAKDLAGISISIDEHSKGEIDFCSPFCICNCCHSQINQPGYFYFQAHLPGYADLNSIFQQHSLKFVTQSIWQPPRLS